MAPENFQNALTAMRQRKPLRPFTVELVSGDRFEIDFPDAVVVRDGVSPSSSVPAVCRCCSIMRA
jgi:hypothetical protein